MAYKDKEKEQKNKKEYYQKNKEKFRLLDRKWRKKNPERASAICKKYRDAHKKERYIVCTNWKKNNPEKARAINRKFNKRKRATLKGNLDHRMEVMIWQSLKKNKAGHKWEKLVGYTVNDLKLHLEKQFKNGLTWERFFNEGYQIDHIKPKSLFEYNEPEETEFKQCWALKNLQPLGKIENIRKGNRPID